MFIEPPRRRTWRPQHHIRRPGRRADFIIRTRRDTPVEEMGGVLSRPHNPIRIDPGLGWSRDGITRRSVWACCANIPSRTTRRSSPSWQTARRSPPRGLFGGQDGKTARYTLVSPNGHEPICRRSARSSCRPEAIVRYGLCGGGGYGNPFERDPALVLRDVREGKGRTSSVRDRTTAWRSILRPVR